MGGRRCVAEGSDGEDDGADSGDGWADGAGGDGAEFLLGVVAVFFDVEDVVGDVDDAAESAEDGEAGDGVFDHGRVVPLLCEDEPCEEEGIFVHCFGRRLRMKPFTIPSPPIPGELVLRRVGRGDLSSGRIGRPWGA